MTAFFDRLDALNPTAVVFAVLVMLSVLGAFYLVARALDAHKRRGS